MEKKLAEKVVECLAELGVTATVIEDHLKGANLDQKTTGVRGGDVGSICFALGRVDVLSHSFLEFDWVEIKRGVIVF